MMQGLHWEWRGFGGVSGSFVKQYCDLPLILEPQKVEDLYIWIPGLEVNAKLRTGAEGGLKLKRIRDKDGSFEKWYENPQELFDFPLTSRAWARLSDVLQTVNIHLTDNPDSELTRENTINLLSEAGCKTVLVKKNRENKKWEGPNGDVKIEWTCISVPQPLISIGLENWAGEEAEELNDELAKKDLSAAIEFFELKSEPLQIMNYMVAVELWSGGSTIF